MWDVLHWNIIFFQVFKRFVEIGRVAFIAFGAHEGKLVAIVDVIDQNRVSLITNVLYNINSQPSLHFMKVKSWICVVSYCDLCSGTGGRPVHWREEAGDALQVSAAHWLRHQNSSQVSRRVRNHMRCLFWYSRHQISVLHSMNVIQTHYIRHVVVIMWPVASLSFTNHVPWSDSAGHMIMTYTHLYFFKNGTQTCINPFYWK